MARTRTRLALLTALVALGAAFGCSLGDQTKPAFVGPSELALSLTITASPDTLTRDGASQSLITVTARDDKGQLLSNVSIRADLACLDLSAKPSLYYADFGSLSAKSGVTGSDGRAVFVYTAPSSSSPAANLCQPGTVYVYFTPVGTNYASALPREIELRLVDMGVMLPPSNLTPAFTYTPATPAEYQTVAFDASTSTGAIVSFSWTFGDGATGSGVTATHSYATAGAYAATLTVADAAGRTASKTQSVTVSAGTPPTADFDWSPTNPGVSATITFNAAKSKPAAGRTIVAYDWDFGTGRTGSGITVTKVYDDAATYTVTLTVTDDVGHKGVTSKSVTVSTSGVGGIVASFTFSPTDPVITGGHNTVYFDASTSSSPNGLVSYAWNFGDGTTGTGVAPAHTFTVASTYVVRLTVTDALGKTATTTQNVKIGT